MTIEEALFDAEAQMESAVDYFRIELRGVRTGRAHVGLVDHLHVDYYGSKSELRQLAAIGTPSPEMILIKPFDPASLKDIERAILVSDIGLTPTSDGKVIRLVVPPLSGERRKQLVHQVKKMAEDSRVAVRNARRDVNKAVDQLEEADVDPVSEDDAERARKEIGKLTEKYEAKVNELLAEKEKEIETA